MNVPTSNNAFEIYLQKTLLIIGGGIETIPGIRLAKEMDLRVVVSDRNPNAPGFACADDQLLADTYDIEATVAAARDYHFQKYRISGVMCIASDVPLTVASVAADLCLPGISLNSARLAMDKLAMKNAFYDSGVPIPWYNSVKSAEHLAEIADRKGLPIVIKPVDSRGARGVLRLTSEVDLQWAYDYARNYSPTGRVMAEEFLTGPQVSTESLVINRETFTPGFSDRNYEFIDRYAPNIIENGGDMPSILCFEIQESVRKVVAEAATSLGITDGVVKGDIVVHQGKPYIIELAARLSGGYFCSHQIPLNTGVDLVGTAIRQALGERLSSDGLAPLFSKGVSQRFLFPSPGKVVSIQNVAEVAERPEIALCEIRIAVGKLVGPVDSHPARVGVVIATGDNRGAATQNAVKAVSDIRIITRPA